jgi:hypothetical protein
MDWLSCKDTWAAAHLPSHAEDKCEEAFFRQVYAMKWHNICSKVSEAGPSNRESDSQTLAECQFQSNWCLYIAKQWNNFRAVWIQTGWYLGKGQEVCIHPARCELCRWWFPPIPASLGWRYQSITSLRLCSSYEWHTGTRIQFRIC